jgi:hypothetical protein
MNFSPYSPSPDDDRSRLPKKSMQPKAQQQAQQQPSFSSYQAGNADSYAEQGLFVGSAGASSSSSGGMNGQQTVRVNKYETSLPIRVDVEASLAYALGPVTGKKRKSEIKVHKLEKKKVLTVIK